MQSSCEEYDWRSIPEPSEGTDAGSSARDMMMHRIMNIDIIIKCIMYAEKII